MKYEITPLKNGQFQLRIYKKLLWMKVLSSIHNGQTIDELLDIIGDKLKKKEQTVDELMQIKNRLQANLDDTTRKLREKMYKP